MKSVWLLLVAAATLVWAEDSEELNRLSLSVDNEGAPAFSVPVRWSKNYFSSLSYASSQIKDHQAIDNSNGQVQMVSGSDVTNIAVNVLSYQDKMLISNLVYTIGLTASSDKYVFDQVGYAYQNSSNYFAQYSNGTQQFYSIGLYGDVEQTNLLDFFSYRVGLGVYPLLYMDYTQTTTSVPTPTDDYSVQDKKMQSPVQYDLYATALIEVSSYVQLLINGSIAHRSFERTYIDYAPSRLDYMTRNYEGSFNIMKIGGKLLFSSLAYAGVSPSIGISYTKNTQTDDLDGVGSDTYSTTSTAYTLGFDKPF